MSYYQSSQNESGGNVKLMNQIMGTTTATTTQKQYITTSTYNAKEQLSGSRHIGTLEDKDYIVVQRTRGQEKSEAERQHHFEELIQDNLRMREVIEQLRREISSYQSMSTTDVTQLRKELKATQNELDAAQRELILLRSQSEERYNSELQKLRLELEEWKNKCRILEEKDKQNAEQMKQLAYYQNRMKLYEQDAKKKFDKLNNAESIGNQLQEQIQITTQLESEIEIWRQKYDALLLQFKSLQNSTSANDQIQLMEQEIEGLLHEIEQWKQRYRALERKFEEATSSKQYELMIEKLKQSLLDKDNQLIQFRKNKSQFESDYVSQDQVNQMSQDYEDQLRRLQAQLDQANQKLSSYDSEMDQLRLQGSVFTSERFDEMQEEIWKYQSQIEQLEKDCDVFMEQIKNLEIQLQEITLKYESQQSELGSYKTMVESNSSKYKTVANLEKELQNIQQELDVWKNRYFQTEIRLKEYDQLKIEYELFLKNKQTMTTVNTTTIVEEKTRQELILITQERDRLLKQLQEYQNNNNNNNNNEIYSLRTQISQQRAESDRLLKQLQEYQNNNNNNTTNNNNEINSLRTQISQLKAERERLLKQLQEYQNNNNNNNNNNNEINSLRTQISQQRAESDRLLKQLQEYQNNNNNNTTNNNNEIYSLRTQISQLKAERDRFYQQIQEYEYKIKNISSQTTTIVDDTKIRELNEILKMKNKQILELETSINRNNNTSTVTVIKEQIRVKETRIIELESQNENLKLDILRLQNIQKDLEARIQVMIEKITVYESKLNIMQEQNIRLSRKSPTRIVEQQTQQDTKFQIKRMSEVPEQILSQQQQSQQQSQQQQQQQQQQLSETITFTQSLYPKEHSNSQIFARMDGSTSNNRQVREVREEVVTSQRQRSQFIQGQSVAQTTQPQIIVSQYKPQQL